MAWFGFGKKKHRDGDDEASFGDDSAAASAVADIDADDSEEGVEAEETDIPAEVSDDYEGRGVDYGPWAVDDEDAPDYESYLDLGAYYLPFLQGIELRVKASRATNQVLGCTISLGGSSLEIEAFAAPKTLGVWEDIRADLIDSNENATEQPGVFGMEVILPVTVKGGKTVTTRIVGVDGPRWMLRGIFSGDAATEADSSETEALNKFFADIVVDRGEEPLAPRDLIPMHAPVTPEERSANEGGAAVDDEAGDSNTIPDPPQGPFDSDQQTETKTTLSRGPMFTEVR